MATFFAFGECEPVTTTEKRRVLLFEPGEFIERDPHDAAGRHIYSVEGFVFPSRVRREALLDRKGWFLIHQYGSLRPEMRVHFRLFDLPITSAFLGIAVSLRHGDPELGGGYTLTGPRDSSGYFVAGRFPADALGSGLPTLNYVPEVTRS
jgi:hypothetical protein